MEVVKDFKLIDEINEIVKQFDKPNNFSLEKVYFVPNDVHPHYLISLNAGRNGDGKWVDYLTNLRDMFAQLGQIFENIWLVNWQNDCPDDVSTILVGAKR